jgi:hypothetical protein
LENDRFAALARQGGIHGEQSLGVKKGEFFREIGIARRAQFAEHFLRELFRADQDFPDLAYDPL